MDHVLVDTSIIQMCEPKSPKFGIKYWGNVREIVTRDYIVGHMNSETLLRCLDNVYVLVARRDSEGYLRPDERKWSDILPVDTIQRFTDSYFPIAIALITENEDFIALEWIDALVRGCNFAQLFIRKLEKLFYKPVIPVDITPNIAYWKHYKDDLEEKCVEIKRAPLDVITGYGEIQDE